MRYLNFGQQALKEIYPRGWVSLACRRHMRTDFGEYELTQISKLVDPRRGAIDVGCHYGIYAYRLYLTTRSVIAFDANPAAAKFVKRALPKVRVENVALSSSEGLSKLRIPRSTSIGMLDGQSTIDENNQLEDLKVEVIDVTTKCLESYELEAIGFIKIDVEGHEENVLAGAAGLIKSSRPTIMVELEERHNSGSIGRVSDLLERHGYSGHFFLPKIGSSNWPLVPMAEFDVKTHQSNELIEILDFLPRRRVPYVNNFVFFPRHR